MRISGAKFEEHCFNISGDNLDSVFYYLKQCLSIVLRIPTAHDFRVISVRSYKT